MTSHGLSPLGEQAFCGHMSCFRKEAASCCSGPFLVPRAWLHFAGVEGTDRWAEHKGPGRSSVLRADFLCSVAAGQLLMAEPHPFTIRCLSWMPYCLSWDCGEATCIRYSGSSGEAFPPLLAWLLLLGQGPLSSTYSGFSLQCLLLLLAKHFACFLSLDV